MQRTSKLFAHLRITYLVFYESLLRSLGGDKDYVTHFFSLQQYYNLESKTFSLYPGYNLREFKIQIKLVELRFHTYIYSNRIVRYLTKLDIEKKMR